MTTLPVLEIDPVPHCTLACVGCSHGAPLAARRVDGPEVYRGHLDRLARRACWTRLVIAGGEPLLHPDLAGFLDGLGAHAREPVIPVVITNGFWLPGADYLDRIAPVAGRIRELIVSRYPPYLRRLGITEWERREQAIRDRLGVQVGTFHRHVRTGTELRFTQVAFSTAPQPIRSECILRRCHQLLPDGRLAKCPIARNLAVWPHMTPEFRESAASTLFAPDDPDAFERWIAQDYCDACRYCGHATGAVVTIPWQSSPIGS